MYYFYLHIQKENLPAYEWLGNHCCFSLALAGPWELNWAGATMTYALQHCAEAAGEIALLQRGLSLARSTLTRVPFHHKAFFTPL